jgi:branched-chain amino acid transport system ATP-binding protein
VLKVRDLRVCYGKIEALKGISIEVEDGEIVTLVGANGAGKSTTLKTISGVLTPSGGTIEFEGRSIGGMPAHKVVAAGICQAPEGRRIFPRMTVRENLDMGAYHRSDAAGIAEDLERVYELFPVLKDREKQPGGTLSGGEQQMLAMARALMSRPKLLMLDEPSMGLAPVLVERIFKTIKEVNDQGRTILLVEQNAHQALQVAHRGYVLQTGTVALAGTGQELLANEMVRKTYLGEA